MDNAATPASFGQKVVTSGQVNARHYIPKELSPECLQAIRELNITALMGLLGENWQSELQSLMVEYWNEKA